MEAIEINYYNNYTEVVDKYDMSSYTLPSYTLGFTYFGRKGISYKEENPEIGILLARHLEYHKKEIENGNLEDFIIDLNDTILHELIHYVGNIKEETGIVDTTMAMMFRNSLTSKWIIDIKEGKEK